MASYYIKLVGTQSALQLTSTDSKGPQILIPNDGAYHLIPLELAQLRGVAKMVGDGRALLSTDPSGTPSVTTVPGGTAAQVSNITDVPGLQAALTAKADAAALGTYAPLASPTFTGHVTVPTPTSATDAVTKAYADALIPPGLAVITPDQYGAVGNGVTDDTTALQAALNACGPTKALYIAPGKIYAHASVVIANKTGTRIFGQGEIRGTAHDTSCFQISDTTDIAVEGVTFSCPTPVTRGSYNPQFKIYIANITGVRMTNCHVNGSASAGILMAGAHDVILDHCTVANTLADGFHCTGGSTNVQIISCTATNTADDGCAVVSYDTDPAICQDITVTDFYLNGQTYGRGITVVGGTNVRYSNCRVVNSWGAGLYIACEPSFSTSGVEGVTVDGLVLVGCNTAAPSNDQGAILVYNGRTSAQLVQDVAIRNVTIQNTYSGASHIVGLTMDTAGANNIHNISIKEVTLVGSNPALGLGVTNVPVAAYQVDPKLLTGPFYITGSNTVVTAADNIQVLFMDCSGGNRTIALPDASLTAAGRTIEVKRVDPTTNTLTVSITGGAQLNNAGSYVTSVTIPSNGDLKFISNGNNYWYTAVTDYTLIPGLTANMAPLSNPTFTGHVTVPTPINTTDAATKAYADLKSPLASVQLYGSGAPSSNLGKDTDTYSDYTNQQKYTKASGTWTLTTDTTVVKEAFIPGTWSTSAGTLSSDTSDGMTVQKLVSAATGNSIVTFTFTNPVDFTNRVLRMALRIDNLSDWNSGTGPEISDTVGFTGRISLTGTSTDFIRGGEVEAHQWCPNTGYVSGTPNLTAIKYLRIVWTAQGGVARNAYMGQPVVIG